MGAHQRWLKHSAPNLLPLTGQWGNRIGHLAGAIPMIGRRKELL